MDGKSSRRQEGVQPSVSRLVDTRLDSFLVVLVGFEASQPGQQLVRLLVEPGPPASGARRRVSVVVLANFVPRKEGAVAALLEGLATLVVAGLAEPVVVVVLALGILRLV